MALEPVPGAASSGPSWSWRYGDADDAPVPGGGRSPAFAAQADAESWVGEHWRELLASGVDAVTLERDGEVVYGPMSLHPGSG